MSPTSTHTRGGWTRMNNSPEPWNKVAGNNSVAVSANFCCCSLQCCRIDVFPLSITAGSLSVLYDAQHCFIQHCLLEQIFFSIPCTNLSSVYVFLCFTEPYDMDMGVVRTGLGASLDFQLRYFSNQFLMKKFFLINTFTLSFTFFS